MSPVIFICIVEGKWSCLLCHYAQACQPSEYRKAGIVQYPVFTFLIVWHKKWKIMDQSIASSCPGSDHSELLWLSYIGGLHQPIISVSFRSLLLCWEGQEDLATKGCPNPTIAQQASSHPLSGSWRFWKAVSRTVPFWKVHLAFHHSAKERSPALVLLIVLRIW